MTIHWLDYAIIILYFFVVVYIGYWAMKKVTNFDDYAVAGRGLPMSIFFAAIAATLCGGGATIGRVSFMHTTGIVVFAGLIGVVINQIFSGLYIAGRVHNIRTSTAWATSSGCTTAAPGGSFPASCAFSSASGCTGCRFWRWEPSSRPPWA